LPPYSPELNPVELLFRQLRQRLANRIFADLQELEATITEVLMEFWQEPAKLQQLTGFGWWLDGLRSIQPSAA
jgi:transposase